MVWNRRKGFESQEDRTNTVSHGPYMEGICYDIFQCSTHPILPGPDLYKRTIPARIAAIKFNMDICVFSTNRARSGRHSARRKEPLRAEPSSLTTPRGHGFLR